MQKDHCCCRGMPFPFHYGTGTPTFMSWERGSCTQCAAWQIRDDEISSFPSTARVQDFKKLKIEFRFYRNVS